MGQYKAEEMKREKIETVKETEGRLKGYSHEMDCRDSSTYGTKFVQRQAMFRFRIQSRQWIRIRFLNFWSSKPLNRFRISIRPKMVDTDPESMTTRRKSSRSVRKLFERGERPII
jgi:hypothetical protein